MKFNGHDKIGIMDIKKKLKAFLASNFINSIQKKLILLDDADYLPYSCQLSLREKLEKSSSGVSFWLVCTFLNKINPTIVSRCVTLKFKYISPLHSIIRLKEISEKENFPMDVEFVETMISFGNGDIRKTFNQFFFYKIFTENKTLSDFEEKMFLCKKKIKKILESFHKDKRLVFFKKFYQIGKKNFNRGSILREKINVGLFQQAIYTKGIKNFCSIHFDEHSRWKVFFFKKQVRKNTTFDIRQKRF